MSSVYSTEGFSTNLSDWFISQNGHVVFIPRLIYVLNMFITDGSNIGLTITAWLLAMVQSILLVLLIPSAIWDNRIRLMAIVAVSGFSFAPTATDNWMHGFSGVHWILANVLSIGAIICITRFFERNSYSWVVASLLLAGLALITYGTAIGLWLALIAAFIFIRSKLQIGLLITALTILVFAASLASRPLVPPSSVSTFDRVIVFVPYLAIFLGGIFTTNIPLAFVIGLAGLIVAVIMLIKFGVRAKKSTQLTTLPWLLVLVYSLVNISFIAITRLEFGLAYATTMRYVTMSGLFWIVILVLWAYQQFGAQKQNKWPAVIAYITVTVLIIVAMLPLGLTRFQNLTRHASLQPLTILSVNLNVPDKLLVDQSLTIHEHTFLAQVPALKTDGLIPFNKPIQNNCGRTGEQLSLPPESDIASIPGDFEFIDQITPDGIRAIGWLEALPNTVECIILVDQNETIKGKALLGFNRPDLQNLGKTGWAGYAHINHSEDQLSVYIKPVDSPTWRKLTQTRSSSNPGQIRIEVYTGMVGDIYDEYVGLEHFNAVLQKLGYTPPDSDIIGEIEQ